MSLRDSFGRTLREIREAKGLTQGDLGPQRFISDLETGRRKPSWETVEDLAARLRTEPLALLGGISTEASGVIYRAYQSASEDRERYARQVEYLRRALSDLKKEVRTKAGKQRIENALRETEG